MGGRSSNGARNSSQPQLTLTEKLVNKIADKIIIDGWIADSYIEPEDYESINNWHDLLEQLDMTSAEARQYIMEELESDAWDYIYHRNGATEEDRKLTFDDDGTFDTGEDDKPFMKYGEVMKLVKQRLASKGIMRRGN